jgi:hypothetical protein
MSSSPPIKFTVPIGRSGLILLSVKEVQKKLATSLVWDPSYSRHMHAYKVNVCICDVIGTEV